MARGAKRISDETETGASSVQSCKAAPPQLCLCRLPLQFFPQALRGETLVVNPHAGLLGLVKRQVQLLLELSLLMHRLLELQQCNLPQSALERVGHGDPDPDGQPMEAQLRGIGGPNSVGASLHSGEVATWQAGSVSGRCGQRRDGEERAGSHSQQVPITSSALLSADQVCEPVMDMIATASPKAFCLGASMKKPSLAG